MGLTGPDEKTERFLNGGHVVTKSIDASLRKLASLAEDLNKLSDQLNSQIEAVEAALGSLGLGVWAWVQVSSRQYHDGDLNADLTEVLDVGYGKRTGRWGLLVLEYCEQFGDEDTDPIFLRDASREIRIAAVAKIPELLEKMVESTEALTVKAKKRVEETKEIAEALSKGRS